jgi:hypothetical protein
VEQKERKIGSQEDELKPNLSSYKLLTRDKNSCQNMLMITRYMMNITRERDRRISVEVRKKNNYHHRKEKGGK